MSAARIVPVAVALLACRAESAALGVAAPSEHEGLDRAMPAATPASLPAVDAAPPSYAKRLAATFVDDPALALVEVARVKTGSQPKSVSASPDGQTLWVANFGFLDHKNVYVYDAATLARVGMVEFGGNAVEVAFSPDGERAYVSNFARDRVEVVDVATFEHIGRTRVLGAHPKVIASSPDGARLYVANWSSHSVAVLDADSLEIVERLETGKRPRGMAVAASGTLYVTAMYDDRVHAFGPVPGSFSTCGYPRHALLDPSDAALFLTCSGDDLLRWYEPSTGEVLGEVGVGDNPRSAALSDDAGWAAVANFDASSVTLVDLFGGRVHTTAIPDTEQIVGIALAKGSELRVFATSWGNNRLVELRIR